MQHPFQCIATVTGSTSDGSSQGYLLAASGPLLSSISLTSGEIVSEWAAINLAEKQPTTAVDDDERPVKKQKATVPQNAPRRNIIKLCVTKNKRHAVLVTDDKCVRVLSVSPIGELCELSSRSMPKRPCAIQVLPDNATILCGDKFGDVYSLPLLPQDKEHVDTPPDPVKPPALPFKPSATAKTVHTQRNLKSLAAQQAQQNITPKTKQPLDFEHEVLLGHVSMLTDMLYTENANGNAVVITADRDEHIRISRAPPQTYVIEGYCLGHNEFISKMAVIPELGLLFSGGGDNWVGAWDLNDFTLKQKYQLPLDVVAVSGIWAVRTAKDITVVVACEKVKALYCINISPTEMERSTKLLFVETDSPVLDLAPLEDSIILSLDAREGNDPLRACLSVDQWRNGVHVSKFQHDRLRDTLRPVNSKRRLSADEQELNDLVQGIEKLRKRGYHEDADAAAEEGEHEQNE